MQLNKILIFFILLFVFSCSSSELKTQIDLSETDFVYLDKKQFKIRGEVFFPVMLNYVVCFRNIGNSFYLSPVKEYENPEIFEANTKDSLENQIKGHLQLIKEMGFNSIRLVFDRVSYKNSEFYYHADSRKLSLLKDSNIILNSLEHYLKFVNEAGLKVMLLIKAPVENEDLEAFTIQLLKRFGNNPVIFAYDFFNEPLYFDQSHLPGAKQVRKKKEAYNIVLGWKDMMNKYAGKQLLTIGFSEPIEVFEWDPSILAVDFVSFHTYNPLRVPNEIYWYGKYIDKPWMIGETALPADGDSVSYEEQSQFMREVFRRLIDCGGSGLAWWEFQEVPNSHFEAQYTGLMNHKGITITKDGKYKIIGTVKPAINEIAEFKNYKPGKIAKPWCNYYNMMGYNNYVIFGKILNSIDNTPVEGAVIRGWNEGWSIGMNTFSNEKGEFSLYSNDECVHFEISAPKMSKIKFNYQSIYTSLPDNKISISNLPDRNLEYHSISYKNFQIKNTDQDKSGYDNSIFGFDSLKFTKAKYQGYMEKVYLKPLSFIEK